MASLEGMIRNLNDRMDLVAKQLGKESKLYQYYTKNVTAILGRKNNVVNVGNGGRVTISRSKAAQAQITQREIEIIKEIFNKSTLTEFKRKAQADAYRKRQLEGKSEKESKKKLTSAELQARALKQLDSTERFKQLIEFMYENAKEPDSALARNVYLSAVGKNPGDYASMVEFAKLAIKIRNEKIKKGEIPGRHFVDYAVFDEVLTGGDLFD